MSLKNPTWLYKNLITSQSQLVLSSNNNATMRGRLLDKYTKYRYQSSGATGSTVTIVWTPSASTSVSRFILQNTNFADFTIKYNSAASDFSPAIAVTGASGGDFYFEVVAQAVTDVTITITATSPAAEEKKIGETVITTSLLVASETFSAVTFTADPYQKLIRLSNGKYQKVVLDTTLQSISSVFSFVSESQIDSIETMLDENDINPIVFIPRPYTHDADNTWDGVGGHFHISNGRQIRNFTGQYFAAGHDVQIDLLPAGGA